jgi:hypothetical protein
MINPYTAAVVVLCCCAAPLIGCKPAPHGRMLNEGLRLTPEQIARDERAAAAGDAAAAKRLWHHYDFVEVDVQKGEMWRKEYEKLTNAPK